MSLIPRGRIWWCEWRIRGRRVRESTGTTDRKRAQEYHDRRKAELWREASFGERAPLSWDEAALKWLEEHAKHKRSYEDDVYRMRWLQERLSGKPLAAITRDTLIDLAAKKATESSNATANRHLAVVSAVLRYSGRIVPVPYLPEKKERIRYLSQAEAAKLITELPKHLALMARFSLATGLRRANVTRLKWEDVDLERRIAWVWPDETKASKALSVPLNPGAMAVLQEAKTRLPWVFTYRRRQVRRTGTKAFYAACTRAGIEDFRWHDLRHTWATWHVQHGTPLEVLQKLGGWASYQMVLRYAHLAPSYVRQWADALPHVLPTQGVARLNSTVPESSGESVGWRMGFEPTTTGITIRTRRKKAA